MAKGNGPDNFYIQSATLNGQALDTPWLDFSQIAAGGTMVLKMGPTPSEWGAAASAQ